MLDIFICEDDEMQLKLFKKYVSDTIMIEALDMRIAEASNDPRVILDKISPSGHTGVFFLDIELKSDIDGLTLAREIRKVQPRCFIVFITSHSEMSLFTFQYKLEALDFIVKDTPEHIKGKIHECLVDVQEKLSLADGSISRNCSINLGDRCLTVGYDEIMFFETSGNIHKIVLHLKNKTVEFSGQLKDMEKQLDSHFFRCHRSYIINRDNVSSLDFNNMTVTMKNNEVCPISVRRKKEIKKIFP